VIRAQPGARGVPAGGSADHVATVQAVQQIEDAMRPPHPRGYGGLHVVEGGGVLQSRSRTSRMSWAVSDGVLPTFTPTASRASFLACAVPEDPDTIAPA
jgi:hypothetical protein